MTVVQKIYLTSGAVAALSTAILFGMEFTNSAGLQNGLPTAVFVALAAFSFFGISSTALAITSKGHFVVRIGNLAVGLFCLTGWLYLFADQLPCFLGGSGC